MFRFFPGEFLEYTFGKFYLEGFVMRHRGMWVVFFVVTSVVLVFHSRAFAGDPGKLFQEARERIAVKDFEGALSVYEEILDSYPDDLDALLGKARVLSWMGRYEEARAVYRDALRVDPENVDAELGIADTFAWQWDYDRAISMARKLERRNPRDRNVLIRLARYNLWAGNREEAIYYAERVKRDYPDDQEADDIIRKAGRLYRYRALVGYEFLNITNDVDGHSLYGFLDVVEGKGKRFFGGVEIIDRFDEQEGRISGGGSFKVSDKLEVSVEAGIAPGADVLPQFSGWVELASPALPSWVVYGSFSTQIYSDADVYNFSVAGEYFPYGYLSLFTRVSVSRTEFDLGRSSTDGSILFRTTYYANEDDEFHVYVGYGNEAYKSETIDLVGDIEAKIIGAGGTYYVSPSLGLSPGFEFQDRSGGTRYYTFTLDLLYRW